MKHLHIDRTPHESRLYVVLYGHFADGLLLLLGVPSGKCQRGEFDNLLWDVPNGPS